MILAFSMMSCREIGFRPELRIEPSRAVVYRPRVDQVFEINAFGGRPGISARLVK